MEQNLKIVCQVRSKGNGNTQLSNSRSITIINNQFIIWNAGNSNIQISNYIGVSYIKSISIEGNGNG